MKIGKSGISPFSSYDRLRAGREKLKPTLEGDIRSPRREAQRENYFRENLALRAFRQLSVFVISSCDSTRFCSLRLLELGISPTALIDEASTLL
ncbi:hypothetical protein DY000_02020855 [Brassica cretica]|uniref:Uncharacterized protein n=1 Tax=Brassica cretica TaxID=69181 RepID=A0ABQ7EI51_BRACR|nr:hypothetical protein DY000_02020855 [Brassica cretica]